jgi:RNA recognition motif-containing protein
MNYYTDHKNLDEYCSKATRTLYIGNLDRDIKEEDLRERLDKKYGDILNIEIKRDQLNNNNNNFQFQTQQQQQQQQQLNQLSGSGNSTFAFIEFTSIKSVIKAIKCMDGKCIGNSIIRLGFGKIKPSQCVWFDDLSEKMSEKELKTICKHYGTVKSLIIDKLKGQAIVNFTSIEHAKLCVQKIRAKTFHDKRIMIDFASNDFKKRFGVGGDWQQTDLIDDYNYYINDRHHHHHHNHNHHNHSSHRNESRETSPHSTNSSLKYINNKRYNYSTTTTTTNINKRSLSISKSRSRSNDNSTSPNDDSISRSRSNDRSKLIKSPLLSDNQQSPQNIYKKKYNKKYECKLISLSLSLSLSS